MSRIWSRPDQVSSQIISVGANILDPEQAALFALETDGSLIVLSATESLAGSYQCRIATQVEAFTEIYAVLKTTQHIMAQPCGGPNGLKKYVYSFSQNRVLLQYECGDASITVIQGEMRMMMSVLMLQESKEVTHSVRIVPDSGIMESQELSSGASALLNPLSLAVLCALYLLFQL